jgi:hypothetical protein
MLTHQEYLKGGNNMKNKIKWIVLGFLFLIVIVLTFTRTPEEIVRGLGYISSEVKYYSVFVHILFLVVIGLGLLVKQLRNTLFSLFIAFLSLSATVIAVKYMIVPNILMFGMLFVLIVHAYVTKNLNFGLRAIPLPDLLFGILGLVFGFWYLHWVDSPIWLNALLYSPLGVLNCPTLMMICGFLILSSKPRSAILEAIVALATLYFGFFGILRLGAYVDVVMLFCSLYLLLRWKSRHAPIK